MAAGGYKEIIAEVTGKGVFARLKFGRQFKWLLLLFQQRRNDRDNGEDDQANKAANAPPSITSGQNEPSDLEEDCQLRRYQSRP